MEPCLTWKQKFLFEIYGSRDLFDFIDSPSYNFDFDIKYFDEEIDDSCSREESADIVDDLNEISVEINKKVANSKSDLIRLLLTITQYELIVSSVIRYKSTLCDKILKSVNRYFLFILNIFIL